MLAGASRRHRPVFSEGLSNYFLFHLVCHFCQGVGSFLFGDFSFWSGERAFFEIGDFFLFHLGGGGGSPLIGENKAFMAEPSDRPAINDGLLRKKKKGGGEYEKKTKCENKNLTFCSNQVRKFQPGREKSSR